MSLDTESRGGGESRRRIGGFFTSLPGILTASAAVITAGGGIYLQSQDGNGGSTQPPPNVIVQQPLDHDVDSQSGFLDDYESGDIVDDCVAGDVDACTVVLDTLAQACSEGDGEACDLLYLVSPSGSAYEEYGQTCGYLYEPGHIASCVES